MLSPIISIIEGNKTLVLTDETVYGGLNPTREEVTVEFKLVRKLSNGNKEVMLPLYDSETVSSVEVSSVDGWYEGTIFITDINTGEVLSSIVNYFRITDLNTCRLKFRESYICACCEGNEDVCAQENFMKIDVVIRIIIELVSEDNYSEAQCLIEGIETLCNKSKKKNCGC